MGGPVMLPVRLYLYRDEAAGLAKDVEADMADMARVPARFAKSLRQLCTRAASVPANPCARLLMNPPPLEGSQFRGTESLQTPRWSKPDSNSRSHLAVLGAVSRVEQGRSIFGCKHPAHHLVAGHLLGADQSAGQLTGNSGRKD